MESLIVFSGLANLLPSGLLWAVWFSRRREWLSSMEESLLASPWNPLRAIWPHRTSFSKIMFSHV